jgi:hypothetical protein
MIPEPHGERAPNEPRTVPNPTADHPLNPAENRPENHETIRPLPASQMQARRVACLGVRDRSWRRTTRAGCFRRPGRCSDASTGPTRPRRQRAAGPRTLFRSHGPPSSRAPPLPGNWRISAPVVLGRDCGRFRARLWGLASIRARHGTRIRSPGPKPTQLPDYHYAHSYSPDSRRRDVDPGRFFRNINGCSGKEETGPRSRFAASLDIGSMHELERPSDDSLPGLARFFRCTTPADNPEELAGSAPARRRDRLPGTVGGDAPSSSRRGRGRLPGRCVDWPRRPVRRRQHPGEVGRPGADPTGSAGVGGSVVDALEVP